MPEPVSKMSHAIYRHRANPTEFENLTRRLKKIEQLLRKRTPRKARR